MTAKPFVAILCLATAGVCHGQAAPGVACQSVAFGASLTQGERLDKDIGNGLILRIWPTPLGKSVRNEGWFIDVVSRERPTKYYLNWVNIPVQEGNRQVLGPGYNAATRGYDTADQSLSHPRKMRFLLTDADYDQVSIAAHGWSDAFEGNPEVFEEAEGKYQLFLKLVDVVPTGQLDFRILSYEVDPRTGFPLRIHFQAELTAPTTFRFDRRLNPGPAQCPR